MYQRARLGIGYLPQEASIFRGLTVEDNIRAVLEMRRAGPRSRARTISTRCSRSSTSRTCARRPRSRSPAASGGAPRSPARWPAARPSCCSTSRSPASTRSPSARSRQLVRHLTRRGIGVLITDHNVRETLRPDRPRLHHPFGRGADARAAPTTSSMIRMSAGSTSAKTSACSALVSQIPKFVSSRSTLVCELRNRKDTSNLLISSVA